MENASHLATGSGMDRPVERRGRFRRRRSIWVGGAVAAASAAVLAWFVVPSSGTLAVERVEVSSSEVARSPFKDYIPLRAVVAPASSVIVTTISGGQVSELAVDDGALVGKGQPLARLSNPQLQLEVASRSADIAGQLAELSGQRLTVQSNRMDSEQEVAAANNDLVEAETALRQKRWLQQKGIVNQAAVDPLEKQAQYQRSRVAALSTGRRSEDATLRDQSARIGDTAVQLRESLAMIRGSLSGLVVRAPVAGRLTAFEVQLGQLLKPGDPVGQIDSEGEWTLTADVDQFYLGRVRTGQRALAELDGRAVELVVAKILPQVTNGRFRIEMAFRGSTAPRLNRGQSVEVRLVLGADAPAVVAPAGPWLEVGGSTAFVLSPDGSRAERRTIRTGRRNPDQVEVLSGLEPGERIVTSPLERYADYQTIYLR